MVGSGNTVGIVFTENINCSCISKLDKLYLFHAGRNGDVGDLIKLSSHPLFSSSS